MLFSITPIHDPHSSGVKFGNLRGVYQHARQWLLCALVLITALGSTFTGVACSKSQERDIGAFGETPGITRHISNEDLSQGNLDKEEVISIGKQLFETSFNTLDGAGNSKTRLFTEQTELSKIQSRFNRISGPDANACSGCHNLPSIGGGGDNVANVFVRAHRFPNINFDVGPGDLLEDLTLATAGNERGTISIFGSGFIELLAREMTTELQAIRDKAQREAMLTQQPVTVTAKTKGVFFGKLTAWPDGLLDTSEIEGVDEDLIIKPFGQKGVYPSLREFTLDALQAHHGMQGEERVGSGQDGDRDGVSDEITTADTTALTFFQATLPPPAQVKPASSTRQSYVESGELIFESIGCTECHRPYLELENPVYTEPNPFNPPGTLSKYSIPDIYEINLYENTDSGAVRQTDRGTYLVYAYTDLKRHNMGPLLSNEKIEQRFVESPVWITRKLWGMVSEPPFLHHGRATLIQEAILAHGGESEDSRIKFENLTPDDAVALLEFLKTFQANVALDQ